ncbi:hypothetical protein [Streptomyces sp. WELS2]|uniref:hypothetical protein n=1 Tax=Streptomyces sp. WELS2 TaxID=2749435 RepID=UPI0015F08054|nr:hypothetical protein [Streptomyces sp. WELS2]
MNISCPFSWTKPGRLPGGADAEPEDIAARIVIPVTAVDDHDGDPCAHSSGG